jgi:hypothetical protein
MPRARAANKYVSYPEDALALLFVGGACRRNDVAVIDLVMEAEFRAHQWGIRHIGGQLEMVSRENVKAYRLVLGHVPRWLVPCYRNGNRLDLRRANLTFSPRCIAQPKDTDLYTGVRVRHGAFYARINFRGHEVSEIFMTLAEAQEWRDQKERELVEEARRLTPHELPRDPPRYPRCPPFLNEGDDEVYALVNGVAPPPVPEIAAWDDL